MEFPIKINDDPVGDDTFYNNKWKETDCYLHSTKSEFFCCAWLITVDKQLAQSANEAIVYLLQRSVIEEEAWTEQMMKETTPEQFAGFVLSSGYLHTEKGIDLSVKEFLASYTELIVGMQKENSYTITKNGTAIAKMDLDCNEDRYILSVTCFIDKWNYRQYMFETPTHRALFRWSTGA